MATQDMEIIKAALKGDAGAFADTLDCVVHAGELAKLANHYRAAALHETKAKALALVRELEAVLDKAGDTDAGILAFKAFLKDNTRKLK